MRVYIAGPYTHGDVAVNVRNAMLAGLEVIKAGHAAFIPHLSHFIHLLDPQPYEFWTCHDMAWVDACDCVLRLPGHSPGADMECDYAVTQAKMVFFTMKELLDYMRLYGGKG